MDDPSAPHGPFGAAVPFAPDQTYSLAAPTAEPAGHDLSGLPSLTLMEQIRGLHTDPVAPQSEATLDAYEDAARDFEFFLEYEYRPDAQERLEGQDVVAVLRGPPPIRATRHPAVMAYMSRKDARRKAGLSSGSDTRESACR